MKKVFLIVVLVAAASGFFFLFKNPKPPAKIYKDVPQLVITDLVEGKGDLVTIGKKVTVHYTLHILEDKMIDDTHGKNPVVFRVGEQKVFSGLETGVLGMKNGGKRKLILPSSMAFGASGGGSEVPLKAAMELIVELIEVNN